LFILVAKFLALKINKLKTNNMKKVIILALLFWIELSSFGQVQAIFPNRNSPSKEELKELAFQESAKGFAFRNSLVETINAGLKDTTFKVSVTRLNELFDHLYSEEIYLKEGKYKNSGWNPSTKKIVQSFGHEWTGFGWVFRIGTFSIICIKGDCGNILAVPVTKIENVKQEIVYINKETEVIRDTVYIKNNGNNVNGNNPNNNQSWSASGGTRNYTYWNNWNPPYANYAPMGGAYNYNYGHYNGGGNCNYGHRGRGSHGGYNGNSSQNYNYNHNNGTSTNSASYGTPSNYGYGNSNGTPPSASWSTPTNYTYSNSNGGGRH